MSSQRVSVDRALYVSALSDAIDWTVSFLQSHNGDVRGLGHCDGPAGRCEAFKTDAAKLARYRKAYARAAGHPYPPEDTGPTVTLTELAARYPAPMSTEG